MPFTGCVSYMGGIAGYPLVPNGKKKNTAEILRELHGWHNRRKCDHEDYAGEQKVIL